MLPPVTDIDECQEETHNCSQNANCTDTDGRFYCMCHNGFTGDGVNCTSMLYPDILS